MPALLSILIQHQGTVLTLVGLITFLYLFVKLGLLQRALKWLVSTNYYKKTFAQMIEKLESMPDIIRSTARMRKEIFDDVKIKLGKLGGDLIEIGAGPGCNNRYYQLPEGSSLIVVDYNEHMANLFKESLEKDNPKVKLKKIVVQGAEDMSEVEDNSIPVVVATQLLCSLDEDTTKRVLNEVKRVLKPGGYFFFLEHVIDEPGTWLRRIQTIASSTTGLFPLFVDGCCCDKDTGQIIRQAGFKDVSFKKSHADLGWKWTKDFCFYIDLFCLPRIWGYAQKNEDGKKAKAD